METEKSQDLQLVSWRPGELTCIVPSKSESPEPGGQRCKPHAESQQVGDPRRAIFQSKSEGLKRPSSPKLVILILILIYRHTHIDTYMYI